MEIRIESVNKDNSPSWVRISHGLNKLVTDLIDKEHNDNEHDASEMQFEENALKLDAGDFASRSKAKAKPQRLDSASSSTRTVPIGERTWADIEPQDKSSIAYPVSKQLITLLRHGNLPREEDGAIEFWRLKRLSSEPFWAISTLVWWKVEEHNGKMRKKTRKDFIFVPIRQDNKFFTSELFKVIQDAISLILHYRTMYYDFFEYIYHIGCAINLHSIMNSGLIPGGRKMSKRQAVFVMLVNPMIKEH